MRKKLQGPSSLVTNSLALALARQFVQGLQGPPTGLNVMPKLHSFFINFIFVNITSVARRQKQYHRFFFSPRSSMKSSSTCRRKRTSNISKELRPKLSLMICTHLWPLFRDQVKELIFKVALNDNLVVTGDWRAACKFLTKELWGNL